MRQRPSPLARPPGKRPLELVPLSRHRQEPPAWSRRCLYISRLLVMHVRQRPTFLQLFCCPSPACDPGLVPRAPNVCTYESLLREGVASGLGKEGLLFRRAPNKKEKKTTLGLLRRLLREGGVTRLVQLSRVQKYATKPTRPPSCASSIVQALARCSQRGHSSAPVYLRWTRGTLQRGELLALIVLSVISAEASFFGTVVGFNVGRRH